MTAAVEIDHVSKKFRLVTGKDQTLKGRFLNRKAPASDEYWALRDVSFDIAEGSTFGIIGENGCGKSTLLKCLAHILTPNEGTVKVNGSFSAMLELGAGFHADLSGRENVYLNGSILGLTRKDIDGRFDEIVEFSGLHQFIDNPVRNYSSGMYVRLGFAIAMNIAPDVLFVDEVLAVGDENFQRKCFEKFADYRAAGRTVVIVSHGLGALRTMCDQVAWLEDGKLVEIGKPSTIIDAYTGHSQPDLIGLQSDAQRWGSGEIQVTGAALIHPTGKAVRELKTGDDITLRVHVRAALPVEEPALCLTIQRMDGAIVSGPGSRDVELPVGTVSGDGVFELALRDVSLLPGTYEIVSSIRDHHLLHIYDHLHPALRFTVNAGTHGERSGVVTLRPDWSFTPDA
jgi:ABC-2 type transport system ATP-binding protein